MNLFKNLILIETQRRSEMERLHTIKIINKIYNEWKYKKRRKNAVDLITTSVNKISNIDPSLVRQIHEASRLKLATILMRCMDNPPWKPISSKEKIFRKISPLISILQEYNPETGTDSTLCEIIMTRLSACISYSHKDEDDAYIFVAYEKKLPKRYLKYIFGDVIPEKTYRMPLLSMPSDFDTLVNTLNINYKKCVERYSDC